MTVMHTGGIQGASRCMAATAPAHWSSPETLKSTGPGPPVHSMAPRCARGSSADTARSTAARASPGSVPAVSWGRSASPCSCSLRTPCRGRTGRSHTAIQPLIVSVSQLQGWRPDRLGTCVCGCGCCPLCSSYGTWMVTCCSRGSCTSTRSHSQLRSKSSVTDSRRWQAARAARHSGLWAPLQSSAVSCGASAATRGAEDEWFAVSDLMPGAWVGSRCTCCAAARLSSMLLRVRWVRLGQADRLVNSVGSTTPLKQKRVQPPASVRWLMWGQAVPTRTLNAAPASWQFSSPSSLSFLTAPQPPLSPASFRSCTSSVLLVVP
mmetsp:Transcript_7596/g.18856  ORF Transcript_7596/g.18856 Transcript_7596/m.18856 type:complete len:321 (-) Transcript_7596:481-1443(-)